ncbi:hypothetical protein AMTR_s00072p00053710 [Amborella trichopoda]|uniref:Uncharacterized protein n=1 Tax=Amborella trichopoda TaxID=13333 RepID=W1NTE2_AMBTC|nr:hypothetical protein AMTR_s00072p00053710 [Amborella trichopoda]
MWEGQVFDCFEDRRIAIETGCCPCSTFGKNMARAGFGSCFLQGGIHLLIVMIALVCFIAYAVTSQICFLYVAGAFTISVGLYLGYFRIQIRKRFNISGTDGAMEDCVNHLLCHCCTLCQESRTLEMNNVRDGVWHGRSDTICIGGSQREAVRQQMADLNLFFPLKWAWWTLVEKWRIVNVTYSINSVSLMTWYINIAEYWYLGKYFT